VLRRFFQRNVLKRRMSNRYRQTADLLPVLGTVLRSDCDQPSNNSFWIEEEPEQPSTTRHPVVRVR
jgi:hypothetical protein